LKGISKKHPLASHLHMWPKDIAWASATLFKDVQEYLSGIYDECEWEVKLR